MQKNCFLVTGARAPVALEWVRRLYAQGHDVYTCDSLVHSLAGCSAAVKAYLRLPAPALEPERFGIEVLKIIQEYHITHVLPTCEEVFYWAALWQKAQPQAQLIAPSFDKLRTYHSKYLFARLVLKFGLHAPATQHISHRETLDIKELSQKQFVLKPEFSRFATRVFIQTPPQKLIEIPQNLSIDSQNTWVLQDYIAGKHFCSYAFALKGQLKALAVYEAVFRTGQHGACYHFQQKNIPEIESINQHFIASENYHGQLALDFIQSESNGKFYLLECNPRATSGLHLLPEQAFWVDEFSGSLKPKEHQAAMLAAVMLTDGLLKNLKPKKLKLWFQAYQQAQDVIWSNQDQTPFWQQAKLYREFWQIAKQQKISILEASTYGIAWDGSNIIF
ncbi:MAG: ATP-grasp domain-containing protein [Cytophagales bacterium]|nr:MAG: ATP-grasp domain-containing protein [Cytophagales bacterium]TAF60850.1 MAG: ATP-grasp domain-containing protein [Cytophagales bacterium]